MHHVGVVPCRALPLDLALENRVGADLTGQRRAVPGLDGACEDPEAFFHRLQRMGHTLQALSGQVLKAAGLHKREHALLHEHAVIVAGLRGSEQVFGGFQNCVGCRAGRGQHVVDVDLDSPELGLGDVEHAEAADRGPQLRHADGNRADLAHLHTAVGGV